MKMPGSRRFVAFFAGAFLASLATVTACSGAPEETSGAGGSELRAICFQEPVTDCHGYDFLSGFVVPMANERCGNVLIGRTTFTGTPGQQFLAGLSDDQRTRQIPRLTAAMASGAQPFCVYQTDTDVMASFESGFCSLSPTVDILCAPLEARGKPPCARCYE